MTTKRYTVRNNSDGARTFYAGGTQRQVRPGGSEVVELTEAEYTNAVETAGLIVQSGDTAGKGPAAGTVESGDKDKKNFPDFEAMTKAEIQNWINDNGGEVPPDQMTKADMIQEALKLTPKA